MVWRAAHVEPRGFPENALAHIFFTPPAPAARTSLRPLERKAPMTPSLRPLALALLALTATAHAQDSRITQVKVYPGSATIERVARAKAGARTLTFACLPAGLDVQSLQVAANASVRLGETTALTETRDLSPRCAAHPLDDRIRALEAQKDTLSAEHESLGLVTGYLRGVARGRDTRAAADAKQLTGVADAVRRTGQDALAKQRQLVRQQADLDRQLAPLLAGRTRTRGPDGQVVTVTVTLATAADADVTLRYQVAGPTWSPAYRALLDTPTRQVRLERQALVAQSTGEDWAGVKLVLSTGQPRRETAGRVPTPWQVGIAQPQREELMKRRSMPMAAMAPAPAMMAEVEAAADPSFEVATVDTAFATEFDVPQTIDVASSGQRVAIALGQHVDTARLAVRTSPRLDPSAFLIADLPVPAGVWPTGQMQLYRDGAYVGQGRWNTAEGERLTLSFGRDERVRVTAEPERDSLGTGGFAGGRAEPRVSRAYVVENRHTTPIAVQVLDAAPVSVDEQVRVTSTFSPQPADLAWNKLPGVAMWTLDLNAGQSARVAADHVIGHPKDTHLADR